MCIYDATNTLSSQQSVVVAVNLSLRELVTIVDPSYNSWAWRYQTSALQVGSNKLSDGAA